MKNKEADWEKENERFLTESQKKKKYENLSILMISVVLQYQENFTGETEKEEQCRTLN